MSAETWRIARDVFEGALDRRDDRRASYLERACAGDLSLQHEVELLLEAHAGAGDFLERAARSTAAGTGSIPEGGCIGPYRVIRELGRGGMGVVYLAERADGAFHKRVAVKLVRPGADSREIVRRFRAERQILAGLEHPNIARLLDGGNTEDGLPFFVVEYVEGEPIDRYCESRGLGVTEKLELFRSVSSAVQFAHRNLVVHRDLKPGNVLVTADGEIKLLDFGIAKLLGPRPFSPAPVSTYLDARPMTPQYASPEQVEGGPITTATDVYALGLLLYELLTGRQAYRLESQTPRELEEVVCRRIPPRPSLAVRRTAADGDAARAQSRDPKGLSRRLSGDLDTIVLKALRKEPERRYSSVEQLSEDIGRHLAGRPVLARPDTFWYRGGKFVRRHKMGVAAAVGWVLLVLGFAVAMTVQQRRVTRERDRAELNALRMAAERDKAERTEEFLVGLFEVSDPAEGRGKDVTARELLDRGAERIESELSVQPEVRADLMNTMGRVYGSLGLYEAARPLLEEGLELRRKTWPEGSVDVAESLNELAWLLWKLGDDETSGELFREALSLHRRLVGEEHAGVARSLNGLGLVLNARRDFAGAERLFRESLSLRRRLLGEEHPDVAESLNNLALVLKARGDFPVAEDVFREALSVRRKRFGKGHPLVAAGLANLSLVLEEQGDFPAAEQMARESLAIHRQLHGDRHPEVASGLNILAKIYHGSGDLASAEPLVRESLEINRELLGDEDPSVAVMSGNLAQLLGAAGEYDEAESLLLKSLATFRRSYGPEHPSVATSLLSLAALARDSGDYESAENLFEESLAMFRRLAGDEHPHVGIVLQNFAELYRLQGRFEEAEGHARRALAIYDETLPRGHVRGAIARGILGASLAGLGRFEEAEPLLLESYRILVDGSHAGFRVREALERLVELYETWERPAEAARYREPSPPAPPRGSKMRGWG